MKSLHYARLPNPNSPLCYSRFGKPCEPFSKALRSRSEGEDGNLNASWPFVAGSSQKLTTSETSLLLSSMSMDSIARRDEFLTETTQVLLNVREGLRPNSETMIQQLVTRAEDPLVQLIEVDNESLIVELLSGQGDLKKPRVTMK